MRLTTTEADTFVEVGIRHGWSASNRRRRRPNLRLLFGRRPHDARDYGLLLQQRAASTTLIAGQADRVRRTPSVNTSGGLLSETGTPGMQLIHEGVRQMRAARRRCRCQCEIVRDQQPREGRCTRTRLLGTRLQDASRNQKSRQNKPYWDALHGPADVPVLSVVRRIAGFPLERYAPLLKSGVVWRPAEAGPGKLVSWVTFMSRITRPSGIGAVQRGAGRVEGGSPTYQRRSGFLAKELYGDAPLRLKIETEDGIALPRFCIERIQMTNETSGTGWGSAARRSCA